MQSVRYRNIPEQETFNEGLASRSNKIEALFMEFIDNILSGAKMLKKLEKQAKVIIKISNYDNEYYSVSIEDNIGGVEDIAGTILAINKNRNREDYERFYSYGVKQAFCALCDNGGNWEIFSRKKVLLEKRKFKYVKGPYTFEGEEIEYDEIEDNINWPGEFSDAGTYIKMKINKKILQKIKNRDEIFQTKYYENEQMMFDYMELEDIVEYLIEGIGYRNEELLREGLINVFIETNVNRRKVLPIGLEEWIDSKSDKNLFDLGEGPVWVKRTYGLIKPSESNKKYYKGNEESSGIELIINGRKYLNGYWIWKQQYDKHHANFLYRIEVKSEYPERLPRPLVDKTGISEHDEKFIKLLGEALKGLEKPLRDDDKKEEKEKILKEQLKKKLYEAYNNNIIIKDEFAVGDEFTELNGRVDLRVVNGDTISYYELKYDKINKRAIEQCLRYICLAKIEGLSVNEFILVGSDYSKDIVKFSERYNKIYEVEIILKRWSDYDIDCLNYKKYI